MERGMIAKHSMPKRLPRAGLISGIVGAAISFSIRAHRPAPVNHFYKDNEAGLERTFTMDSKGIFEKNRPQKRTPDYDRYAKKSLAFGIIVVCLIILYWPIGYLTESSVRLNNDIIGNLAFFMTFLFIPIATAVLVILGVIFGLKGLKLKKTGVSIAGLAISGTVLLLLLIVVIYLAAGGEFM
jgi:hypothetical protein